MKDYRFCESIKNIKIFGSSFFPFILSDYQIKNNINIYSFSLSHLVTC